MFLRSYIRKPAHLINQFDLIGIQISSWPYTNLVIWTKAVTMIKNKMNM